MIPVIFAINEGYVNPLRVTLASLLKHAKHSTYAVYVLAYQLSEASKSLLKKDLATLHPAGSLEVVDISDELYSSIPKLGRWAKEVNFRLLSAMLLPDITKAIYLDTDILVQDDLGELYALDVAAHAFAAVMEERPNYRNYTVASYLAKAEGVRLDFLPASAPYINSGVLLLNLLWLRQHNIVERALKLLTQLPESWLENSRYDLFLMPDQDIIYYLAYNTGAGVAYLPDHYNHIVGYYYYKDMSSFASKEQYEHFIAYINHLSHLNNQKAAWQNYKPAIIHYADNAPWNKKRGLVPYEELYRRYAQEIGWKLPNKWLINRLTWLKRRFFYTKMTRDAWGRKGMALLALNLMGAGCVVLGLLIYVAFH